MKSLESSATNDERTKSNDQRSTCRLADESERKDRVIEVLVNAIEPMKKEAMDLELQIHEARRNLERLETDARTARSLLLATCVTTGKEFGYADDELEDYVLKSSGLNCHALWADPPCVNCDHPSSDHASNGFDCRSCVCGHGILANIGDWICPKTGRLRSEAATDPESAHRPIMIRFAQDGLEYDPEIVDDEIDAWHTSDSPLQLHEWLGLTRPEYARFVTHGYSVLPRLIEKMRDQSKGNES